MNDQYINFDIYNFLKDNVRTPIRTFPKQYGLAFEFSKLEEILREQGTSLPPNAHFVRVRMPDGEDTPHYFIAEFEEIDDDETTVQTGGILV